MSKPSSAGATGAHWAGADMKQALVHLPLLAVMRSQEDIFHTDAAGNRLGCAHLGQTTKLLLLLKHFTLHLE